MNKRISIISLGCPKNQVDSEYLAGKILKQNLELTEPEKADYIIIMSCAFIEPAVRETEKVIKEFLKLKKIKNIKIFLGGCYPLRFKESTIKKFPEIDGIFGFDDIEDFEKIINKEKKPSLAFTEFLYSKTLPRFISTRNFAYLKISEGCNENCSFCTIPMIRGNLRSKPEEEIIKEATALSKAGFEEIILISQSTGLYGIDIYKKKRILSLLKNLTKIKELKLIRIFYFHPADMEEKLVKFIVENEKIAPYIDLPIQHISEKVLKDMKRRGGKRKVFEAIEIIKKYIPKKFTVRTELIAGFPSETEKEFKELLSFVETQDIFSRIAVFPYSHEKDSLCYKTFNKKDIKKSVIKERYKILQEVVKQKIKQKAEELINTETLFVPEKIQNSKLYGHTSFDAPEIDIKSYILLNKFQNHKKYKIFKVKIKRLRKQGFECIPL